MKDEETRIIPPPPSQFLLLVSTFDFPSFCGNPFHMKKLRNYLIVAVVLYLLVSGWMIGMPYVRNVVFADEVDNIARGLNYDGTILRATARVKNAASSNNIPITEKNIVILKDPKANYSLVEIKYSVSVSTPFELYTHVWNFHVRAEKGKK